VLPDAVDVAAGPVALPAPGVVLQAASAGTRAGSQVDGAARPDYFAGVYAQVSAAAARNYPRRARLDGVEGIVILKIRLDREGRLAECEISESSGVRSLDRQAIRIAERAAPFGPVPDDVVDADLTFEQPVEFALDR
jgi:protein TonB